MDAMDGQQDDTTNRETPQPKPTTKPRARRAPRASGAKKQEETPEETAAAMALVHGHPARPANATVHRVSSHPSSTAATNSSSTHVDPKQKEHQPTAAEILDRAMETIDPKTVRADQLLDIVTLTHNAIYQPPTSNLRIYDNLFMHAYLFHNDKILLIKSHDSSLYFPIQTLWNANTLPYVSPKSINDQILSSLLQTTGLRREEIVEGWPSYSQKNHDCFVDGVLTSYCWVVSSIWEIRLDVACPAIEPRGVAGWCWASDKEVYMLDRSNLISHGIARLIIEAFKVKKERERAYLGVLGPEGSWMDV